MLKPVTLNCGHSGCQNCIQQLAIERGPQCPTCRDPFDVKTLQVNYTLDGITSDLPVLCLSKGCKWLGEHRDAAVHYEECPKLEIHCSNDQCQHVAIREHMAAHTATCVKRKLPCPNCKKSVIWESMPSHQMEQCTNAVTHCPLGCGSTMLRYAIMILGPLPDASLT